MPFDLAEKFVVAAEHALGAALPDEYKAAMQLSNGGELEANGDEWALHPIADTSDRKRLARTSNHILAESRACQGWRGFPENALAIASNSAGDRLIFLKKGAAFDATVYAWSHETGELEVAAESFKKLRSA
ncbi:MULTISPECIES: SMI1/KNR4 family protein [unclassified Pseudomonas]|uniref:SMI1/KNR4 family protein n=1 Tax=unclassified Pseudomonas TaxID=196821 RepID=UPI00244B0A31|nr:MULTISPECIES: SMI1/KNR4 family protein [unclassified Pseudomonas]MDG9926162.1 SMI1/KNR4 family protein [Pseudomonas sp. GD04045]MDH0037506.1 SMI1/KNR4 family protein [Pseudomonas sp. GD04019]